MKTCFLFPGQGAQHPGMARDLYDASRRIRDLFALASDVVGKDMAALLFEGDEAELKSTDNAQPAITLANVAASMALEDRGIVPDLCAGFSLGEYAALWQAGVLGLEDLFSLVKIRGEAMEEASRTLDAPGGAPGMTAVVGLDIDDIERNVAGIDGVYLANHNSPIQSVLAGTGDGLAAAEDALDAAGAMQIVRLKVSGPFHSPLMEAARSSLAAKIGGFAFSDARIPVFSNATGGVHGPADRIPEALLDQIVTTVRWVDNEESVLAEGPERVLEVGPGTVLRGLWKSFCKKTKCHPAGTAVDIESLL